ncbi:hypothetical protein D3C80_1858740 [compost metagenome]
MWVISIQPKVPKPALPVKVRGSPIMVMISIIATQAATANRMPLVSGVLVGSRA